MIVHFINSSKAPSIGLNFKLVSSYSSCGTESITIPQPQIRMLSLHLIIRSEVQPQIHHFLHHLSSQSVHHIILCLTIQHHELVSSLLNEVSRQEPGVGCNSSTIVKRLASPFASTGVYK